MCHTGGEALKEGWLVVLQLKQLVMLVKHIIANVLECETRLKTFLNAYVFLSDESLLT